MIPIQIDTDVVPDNGEVALDNAAKPESGPVVVDG